MRIRRLLIPALSAVMTAGLLGVLSWPPIASAGCVGSFLAVGTSAEPGPPPTAPVSLTRGQTATVAGVFFHAGCEDTFASGPGCGAAQPADPQTPLTDVRLTLVQGERSWELGRADAADRDQQYAISWVVSIPTDVAAGPATLDAETATLRVQIR